ncbi:ABC transporter substrate-binding protein [Candidatus Dependentiae bacterium]|nr:ABC transporter substrate-binding protein [Candidatus Dependentiae bacterium]
MRLNCCRSSIIILVSIFLLIFLVSCSPKNEIPKIGIIQLLEEEQLNIATEGVKDGLKESGFFDGQNINIIQKSAQGDMSNIPLILKSFENENISLLVTNTTPCMVAAAKMVKKIPVVFTVSFSPQDAGVSAPPDNLAGFYDPFDLEPFAGLLRECVPSIRRIGLPYTSSEVNAKFAAEKIKDICAKYGIETCEIPITSINDIPNAAQALVQKKIGAFVVSADNTVYAGISGLMKTAKEFNIPIFVTDPSIVKNGATIGYGIDYYDWGLQSGKLAGSILKGKYNKTGMIIPYKAYRLGINEKSCKEQNIKFPESIIKKADFIVK